MDDFSLQMQEYIGRLTRNPRIELRYQESDYYARPAGAYARQAAYFEREYGFAIPPDDWGLFSLNEIIHVTWTHKPGLELPGGYNYFDGSIDLNSISTTIIDPGNKLEMGINDPLKEYARYFDMASPLDTGVPTMLLYDEPARAYKGLAVFLRPEIVPIELTPGEYVRKALAWHGARGWQLLYCPLEEFKLLNVADRRQVYRLPLLLPFLFPDDDWSILDTKREYFDWMHVDLEKYTFSTPI